eukprot:snap_masked-scaffold_8-processed-gene-12.23-mRNA-1 protein AED:1.00 eAED:1.00 QI:0/0/0/0/1/1/2/0/67
MNYNMGYQLFNFLVRYLIAHQKYVNSEQKELLRSENSNAFRILARYKLPASSVDMKIKGLYSMVKYL